MCATICQKFQIVIYYMIFILVYRQPNTPKSIMYKSLRLQKGITQCNIIILQDQYVYDR